MTRREFLKSLIPTWLTRRNAMIAGVGIVVALVAYWIVSVVRDVGFSESVKTGAFLVGVFLCVWLLRKISRCCEKALRSAPRGVRVLVRVAGEFLFLAAVGYAGVGLYIRWTKTGDLLEIIIPLGVVALMRFLDLWGKTDEDPR